jgi:hypothetical protein
MLDEVCVAAEALDCPALDALTPLPLLPPMLLLPVLPTPLLAAWSCCPLHTKSNSNGDKILFCTHTPGCMVGLQMKHTSSSCASNHL